MKIPRKLIAKYNKQLPRYTSYPPANYFTEGLQNIEYSDLIQSSNEQNPQNISIYIHIPFCNKICHYCGCNSMKLKSPNFTREYMTAIKTELRLFRSLIARDRKVSQIHWGGGTPNSLPSKEIKEVMDQLYSDFDLIEKPEIAIECNPAGLTENYIKELLNFGFNRFSIGIQDFNTNVLDAVNREIPDISVKEIIDWLRNRDNIKVNLDFIYGLPLQTEDSFKDTIAQAIDLNPDRMVTFSYAHVPWVKPAQKKLEKYHLPVADEKISMFEMAGESLRDAGYKAIGLDHFAKADDELYLALQKHILHRNFQGYCTRETTGQVYAAGISSISQLHEGYLQNTKNIKDYINLQKEGKPSIDKSYILTKNQQVIRSIINELMCNFYLSWDEISAQSGMNYSEIMRVTGFSEGELFSFRDDKLLTFDTNCIEITDLGKFFIRNIAATFDPLSRNTDRKFSKTI